MVYFKFFAGLITEQRTRMGIYNSIWQVALVLAVLCAAGAGGAQGPRQRGRRCGVGAFWNADRQHCENCTRCIGTGHEVTIRPCEGHQDSLCGSIKDLPIDWSWLKDHPDHKDRSGSRRPKSHDAASSVTHERINSLSEREAKRLDSLHRKGLPPAALPLPQGWQEYLAAHEGHAIGKSTQGLRDIFLQGLHDPATGGKIDFGDDYILPDRPRYLPKPSHGHKDKHKHASHHGHYVRDFDDYGASGDDENDDEDLIPPKYHRSRKRLQPAPAHHSHKTPSAPPPPPPPPPRPKHGGDPDLSIQDHVELIQEAGSETPTMDVTVSSTETVVFSRAESVIWDWQAGVLVAAVFACLLFFLVAAIYSCHHAWHFRAMKKHLDADMEEISARLALMSGAGTENLQDPGDSSDSSAPTGKKLLPLRPRMNEYSLPVSGMSRMSRKTRV